MKKTAFVACLALSAAAVVAVVLAVRPGTGRELYAARCECTVSAGEGHLRGADMCRLVDELLESRRDEIFREAIGRLFCENIGSRSALDGMCAALAGIVVTRSETAEGRCRVTAEARAEYECLSRAVARAYVAALKTVVDRDEDRRAAKSLEEAQLDTFRSRMRVKDLGWALEIVGAKAQLAEIEIRKALNEAQGEVAKSEEAEGRIRDGVKRSRLSVSIDGNQRGLSPVVSPSPAPVAQASTNKLARSPRSGQVYWGVGPWNGQLRRFAYRVKPPARIPVTPDQSNDVAKAFAKIASGYLNGDVAEMNSGVASLPAVVTNMPDKLFATLARPVADGLKKSFLDLGYPMEFSSAEDLESYVDCSMNLAIIWGNLYLRRDVYDGPVEILDVAVLRRLLFYRDCFRQGGQREFEAVMDGFISKWHDQIESENGFTHQRMWFQVDLQWVHCSVGEWTPADLSAYVKSFAAPLVNLGYTPKWLSEFDDLSEAVK